MNNGEVSGEDERRTSKSLFRTPSGTPEIRANAVYTISEACEILRISEATARRLVKVGVLKSGRVGRSHRFLGIHLLDALYPSDENW